MRRRVHWVADQLGWLAADAAFLLAVILFLPLVPVFKAFSAWGTGRTTNDAEGRLSE